MNRRSLLLGLLAPAIAPLAQAQLLWKEGEPLPAIESHPADEIQTAPAAPVLETTIKFFGTKEKTRTDHENEAAGRETGSDRTRRLFYVTCSRAKKSLAIVYYSPDPALARDAILQYGWFDQGEVELLT